MPELEDDDELELDEQDWMLGPERRYFEQLAVYRRLGVAGRKRRPLLLRPRLCEFCGEPFSSQAPTARFCSPAHQREARRGGRGGPVAP